MAAASCRDWIISHRHCGHRHLKRPASLARHHADYEYLYQSRADVTGSCGLRRTAVGRRAIRRPSKAASSAGPRRLGFGWIIHRRRRPARAGIELSHAFTVRRARLPSDINNATEAGAAAVVTRSRILRRQDWTTFPGHLATTARCSRYERRRQRPFLHVLLLRRRSTEVVARNDSDVGRRTARGMSMTG